MSRGSFFVHLRVPYGITVSIPAWHTGVRWQRPAWALPHAPNVFSGRAPRAKQIWFDQKVKHRMSNTNGMAMLTLVLYLGEV